MTDMENVIKGLWCCNHAGNCSTCPFDIKGGTDRDEKGRTCLQNLIAAAYDALKAQEPVAPIFDYDGRDVWRCGNCHMNIFHPTRTDEDENEKNYRRFCFHCGRPVKWK